MLDSVGDEAEDNDVASVGSTLLSAELEGVAVGRVLNQCQLSSVIAEQDFSAYLESPEGVEDGV